MLTLKDQILKLTKNLYPTGRAFKMSINSVFEKFHVGLSLSEERAYSDAISILDSIIPDNSNFTTDDAAQWERRLAITTSIGTTLDDRKSAIIRKMNHPGITPSRQHFLYLEGELQKAGFDLFVHENRFETFVGSGIYETREPNAAFGLNHGEFQHGQQQHGRSDFDTVANSFLQSVDSSFDLGLNLRSTFFIGGEILGDYGNVPAEREIELRRLILNIKPVQAIGLLFVNFT